MIVAASILALIAIFLGIAHLAEPFSGRRLVIELVLVLPLILYFRSLQVRSRI